jgi:hypothetical protein
MNLQGKPKYSEETCPGATLSTTKSHMTRSRTPDRSGGKLATNRLSYGAAFPRAIVRLEVLDQLKKITSSGLEPATFRLVA